MISVIITTICRPSLQEAIESVRQQTYKDYELIVIEDKERRGGAWALNQGIDKAQGEFIAILDDDDTWVSKDKLEKQVKFLDDNPEYIAVGTQTEGCQVPEVLSLSGTPFAHSSIMFRNNGIRYNEKFARGKDLDLMLRLSKQGRIETLKDCFIRYTVSNDLKRKIKDCSWHRKVILKNRWFDKEWYIDYWNVLKRQIRLLYYDKIKNIIFNRAV